MKRIIALLTLLTLLATLWISPAAAEGWTCASCATANDGNFCTNCGAARPEPKTCQGCGYTVEADSPFKFCPTCGLEFGKAPATPTPKPTQTPTPTPKKTATPTPERVFKITGVSRSASDGTVTVKWTDSADRGPYEVRYRQHVSESFTSERQKKIWYYIATESTYLNSCTILYMMPSANYWITVVDRDGKEVHYAYKPSQFLTFESFDVGIQLQLRQRKGSGDGVKVSSFSRDDIQRKTLYEWGAYIRLTFPKRGSTKDYVMHFAVIDPNGITQCVYRHECQPLNKGTTSLTWDFYDISKAFEHANDYDGIATGEWRVEVYFNSRYVGCASFRVTK